MNDPRSILMSNIESVSAVPSGLVDALYAEQPDIRNKKHTPNETEDFMKATLDNPYANLSERHRMAEELLKGNPIPASTSGQVIHHHHKKLKSKSNVSLRYMAKNNFLQLKSEAVPIKELNVTEEIKKYRSKKDFSVTGGFTWGNDYISPVPEVYNVKNKTELNKKNLHSQRIASVARAQMESKKAAISRNIEEVKNIRIESMKQKEYIKNINSKKLEDKKKIEDLRQKILERLKDKHDPMLGPIMRCIDDALLFHFMEQFKGYSMSVDAVIALIGKSLGSDNTILKPKETTPDNVELVIEKQPFVADGYGVRSPKFIANANRPVSPHRETMVPPGSAPKSLRDGNMLVEPSGVESLAGWSFGGSTGVGSGSQFPPLSRGKTQEWGRHNPQTKSFGSGFKANTGSPIRNYGKDVEKRDAKSPMRLVSTNSTTEEMEEQNGGSFLRASRKKLFLDNLKEESSGLLSSTSWDEQANQAIDAMRGQLAQEKRLPSQQPLKMFSDAELERIGSAPYKRAEIADMLINRKLSNRVENKGSSTASQMVMENAGVVGTSQFSAGNVLNEEVPGRKPISPPMENGNENIQNIGNGVPKQLNMRVTEASEIEAPRSIKSRDTSKPAYLYNTIAERTAFLGANVAGGAGLSLWGDKRKLNIRNVSASLTSSSKLNKGTTIASPAALNMKAKNEQMHKHQMFT